jgi:hypothetical protein
MFAIGCASRFGLGRSAVCRVTVGVVGVRSCAAGVTLVTTEAGASSTGLAATPVEPEATSPVSAREVEREFVGVLCAAATEVDAASGVGSGDG